MTAIWARKLSGRFYSLDAIELVLKTILLNCNAVAILQRINFVVERNGYNCYQEDVRKAFCQNGNTVRLNLDLKNV